MGPMFKEIFGQWSRDLGEENEEAQQALANAAKQVACENDYDKTDDAIVEAGAAFCTFLWDAVQIHDCPGVQSIVNTFDSGKGPRTFSTHGEELQAWFENSCVRPEYLLEEGKTAEMITKMRGSVLTEKQIRESFNKQTEAFLRWVKGGSPNIWDHLKGVTVTAEGEEGPGRHVVTKLGDVWKATKTPYDFVEPLTKTMRAILAKKGEE